MSVKQSRPQNVLSLSLLVSVVLIPKCVKVLAMPTVTYSPTSLQIPHPLRSPADRFQQMAQECLDCGIKDWDVYGDFEKTGDASFLRKFEAEIAEEFGKEDAVFMPSGVMAQSIALLIHSKKQGKTKRLSFACHASSHVLIHEQEGYQELCDLSALTLPIAEPGVGIHASPLLYRHLLEANEEDLLGEISTVMLELPHRELGGKLTPWKDVLDMQEFLNQRGVAFHCDGARIFEATAGYNKGAAELAEPFDSIYISFYKGLGGLSGAMLMGSKDFCDEARVWLRRFGGNLYTLLPYALSGYVGYRDYWKNPKQQATKTENNGALPGMMSFKEKKEKLVRVAEALSLDENFSQVVALEPPVPKVNMVHCYLRPDLKECNKIRNDIAERLGVSLFHRIRSIDKDGVDSVAFNEGFRCKLEVSIGEANGSIPDNIWIQTWSEFSKVALSSVVSSKQK